MEEIKNFNKSFNHEFCTRLESIITKALAKTDELELKNFWCDGVLHAPFYNDEVNREYLLFENVKKRRTIETTSWIGLDGQTEYKTTIHLGKTALQFYEQGIDLIDSIPTQNSDDWLKIDLEEKTLNIYLN